MINISIDQLAAEITQAVQEYTEDVQEIAARETDKAAKAVLRDTKANAPKDTGDYAQGFAITKEDEYGSTKRIIWNKKHPQRVHLLEHGHAKVKGGRVAARPHVRPAYEKHGAPLPDHIKSAIQREAGR